MGGKKYQIDEIDKLLINQYQGGIPICQNPYASMGEELGISQDDVIFRIENLLAEGILSRAGPMYNPEYIGGSLSLAAMIVPDDIYDAVADTVNSYPEISQNYQRQHKLNMWFVIACDDKTTTKEVIDKIEAETGLKIYNMPKIREYFVGLYLKV